MPCISNSFICIFSTRFVTSGMIRRISLGRMMPSETAYMMLGWTVMASLTRARTDNPEQAPGPLQAEYYAQRASAGLILTEGTWVSRNAIGYVNVPGIYSAAQIEGWKQVTEAVHEKGGKIF